MDGFSALFLCTDFFGGIVTGLAGFAMGLVVSGVWLHILTPAQTASLIVGYGLLTQSYNIWKLRHALNWRTVAPFVTGGVIGVPIGAALVTYVDPNYVRTGVGVLLIVYSVYSLARPHLKPRDPRLRRGRRRRRHQWRAGRNDRPRRPVITMWCNFRGFGKDVQRAIYQPVILAAFVLTAISLAVAGVVTARTDQDLFVRPADAGGRSVGRLEALRPPERSRRFAKSFWCCCCSPAWPSSCRSDETPGSTGFGLG